MPLFDKVKAQAAQVAQKAQEAGRAGTSRLEDAQAKRQLDGLLHDLGAAVYARHAAKDGEDSQAEVDALYARIDQFEAEHGLLAASDAVSDPVAPPPATSSPPAPNATGTEQGNFTL